MFDSPIVFGGDIVGDERQLDGTRHLTLELVDADAAWRCALNLILDRENRLREGSVEIEGPEGAGSAVLDRVLELQVEPALTLSANFRDTESASVHWRLHLRQTLAEVDSANGFEATFSASP
jgi:hypothetical protein